jgi:Family of unknown function (DUF6535)
LRISISSSFEPTPTHPFHFTQTISLTTKYVIWVNSLWFLSLTISLTCALLATLIQQWARRYLRITPRHRYSLHDASRVCAFFAHGVEILGMSRVFEVIPTLIHLSLFLFFAGLLIYLFDVNLTVFCAVVGWVALSAAKLLITFMPSVRLDSPFYAPLSLLAFRIHAGIICPILVIVSCPFSLIPKSWNMFDWSEQFLRRCTKGMEKMAEVVRRSSARIDGLVLKWTDLRHPGRGSRAGTVFGLYPRVVMSFLDRNL